MLEIRPHHLLCTKAFIGKGYSRDFIENMKSITLSLSKNKSQYIEIVIKDDSICRKCPNKTYDGFCNTEKEVVKMDKTLIKLLNIKEGIYKYEKIENLIYNNISEDFIKEVCKNCSWYKKVNCKEIILLKSKENF